MKKEQEILDIEFELDMLYAFHKNGCLDVQEVNMIRRVLEEIITNYESRSHGFCA